MHGSSGGKRSISIRRWSADLPYNTTNYEQVFGLRYMDFRHESSYFSGESTITTYELDELMGTKLRALYSRNKGRDLFDAWYVFSKGLADIKKVVPIFHAYNEYNNVKITKKMFAQNIEGKRKQGLQERHQRAFRLMGSICDHKYF